MDERGRLHLAVTFRGGRWECAEVSTVERLGFGTHVFDVEGPVDALDRSVVPGLFSYPAEDVGRDGTNEIVIRSFRFRPLRR